MAGVPDWRNGRREPNVSRKVFLFQREELRHGKRRGSEMKKNSVLIAIWVISTSFSCAAANAKDSKAPFQDAHLCPANMSEGDCGEYIEGYLNGKSDRDVGEVNVFAGDQNSDAYKQGYEKGWKSVR
jgi:hypothetical protein